MTRICVSSIIHDNTETRVNGQNISLPTVQLAPADPPVNSSFDNMEEMDEVLRAGDTVVSRRKQSRKRRENAVNTCISALINANIFVTEGEAFIMVDS